MFATRVIALAFLALVASGPVVYLTAPAAKTRSSTPFPTWDFEAFRRGAWLRDLEDHLRESSPVTVAFRRCYLEAELLAGNTPSSMILQGAGGWMFTRAALCADPDRFVRESEHRTRFYADLREFLSSREIELIVLMVPDKPRVYADMLPGGKLPAGKRSLYADMLAELRSAGLHAPDLAGHFAELRRQRPGELLYYRRESHWDVTAAWHSAWLIADELRASDRLRELGPPIDVIVDAIQPSHGLPDYVEVLGIRPGGALAERYREPTSWASVRQRTAAGTTKLLSPHEPAAKIALCGDSFAEHGLHWSLVAATGRLVDSRGVRPAKGPIRGLIDLLGEIERGEFTPQLIVWEFIERSVFEGSWTQYPDWR